jgi:hypothetical protein
MALAKLDQILCVRDSLVVNGKVYFDAPMHSDELKKPLPDQSYRLTIPDSLANKYALTSDIDDYEHDYALIYQFSPLLPTHDPDIYFMEFYSWINICDDGDYDGCVRILWREYLRFRIKGAKIALTESHGSMQEFIGFGGFQRKKMQEALPGEKIKHFGW